MKKKSKGFTLVELIVVIAILVILAAILIPTMTGVINDAKKATGQANTRTVYTAATAYVASQYSTTPVSNATLTSTQLATYLGSGFGINYNATVESGVVTVVRWGDGTNYYTFTPATNTFTGPTAGATVPAT